MNKFANIVVLPEDQKDKIKKDLLDLLSKDELVDASGRAMREMDTQLKLTKLGVINESISYIEQGGEIISVTARHASYKGELQHCITPHIENRGDAVIKFQFYEISKNKTRLSIFSAHLDEPI